MLIIALISYKNAKKNKKKLLDYIEQLTNPEVKNCVNARISKDKTSLSPAVSSQIESFLSSFEDNQEYLNQEITLHSFSNSIHVNKNDISAYINSTKNKNFKQNVNELRINYLVKCLINEHDLRNLTIDALAEEAGFKYGTAFSGAFLQHTGFRPSYFIKNLKDKT